MALIEENGSSSSLDIGTILDAADKESQSHKLSGDSLLSQAKANKGGGATAADTHNPGNKGKSQREKPQTGQSGNELNPSIKGRAESNLSHDLDEQGEKASSWKRALTGTAVGALLLGAGGAATGAAIVGGTAGVVALGSTVTFGLIGAAAGSAVPVVGTIVGAGVGLLVGALVGHVYGRASAETANADYLDTRPNAPGNRLQRSSHWALQRATMPENLGKRGLRLAKPARRWWVWRICINLKRLCVSISDDKQLLEWEARGHNATVEEAADDLRYAVASEMAYTSKTREKDDNRFQRMHTFDAYKQSVKDFIDMYGACSEDPKDVTQETLKTLVAIPRRKDSDYEEYSKCKDDNEWRKLKYAEDHNEWLRYGDGYRTILKALSNESVTKWDFRTIGPDAEEGSVEHQIYKALPKDLRRSLRKDRDVFRDPFTGTSARLVYDRANNDVVICYNASGGNNDLEAEQDMGSAANYLNEPLPSASQAKSLGKAVRDAVSEVDFNQPANQKIKVVSTGHCRGGLLANKDAEANVGTSITFNPAPEGGALRDEDGLYSSEVVPKGVNIKNYSVRNDLISGSGIGSFVGNCIETCTGIAMPVIYGPRLILPRHPGYSKHRDPVTHMCHLIAGGEPPRKARWRWGSDVDIPRLYMPGNGWLTPNQDEERRKTNARSALIEQNYGTGLIIEEEEAGSDESSDGDVLDVM